MGRAHGSWASSTPLILALYQSYAERTYEMYGAFCRPLVAWPTETQEATDAPFGSRGIQRVDARYHGDCADFVMLCRSKGRGRRVG